MAQQQGQFEFLMQALTQSIQTQGATSERLAAATNALAEAASRVGQAQSSSSSAVSSGGATFDTGAQVLKGPDLFSPGTLEEEVSLWSDWSFVFKNYLAFMDPGFLDEFKWAEQHIGVIDQDEYNTRDLDSGKRAVKLYSILSGYLRNRPLKTLRSVTNNDGFEVWRKLTSELQPTSRSRSLAMAQALVSFPAMSKGASLYDYVLTYEKLVTEYEKLSGSIYDQNLKIGTLMKGIPNDLRRALMLELDDKTTYDQMRARLLAYERSSQTWSAENILSGLSVQGDSGKTKEYHGPIPID